MIQQMLASKKFVGGLVSLLAVAIVCLAGRFKIVLDEKTAELIADRIVVIAASYLVGQGIADHGKEAAKIRVE